MLDGISWETYELILRDLQERQLRITYDRGDLEISERLAHHEEWKCRYRHLIELTCVEREIDFEPVGSATLRRRDLRKGLEPDECYYLQHANAIRSRGNDDIDLSAEPPPDLALEIEITRASIPMEPIYAALEIPELWRFAGCRLTVLQHRDGAYVETCSSGLFPFLPMGKLQEFGLRLVSERQPQVLREFRTWVATL